MTPLGPVAALPAISPMGTSGVPDMAGSGDAVPQAAASGFGDMLAGAVSALNGQMVGSERLSEQAATGGLPDPTVALVAVEEADLAFNTAVQVRNKLVEGWQELSRMSV